MLALERREIVGRLWIVSPILLLGIGYEDFWGDVSSLWVHLDDTGPWSWEEWGVNVQPYSGSPANFAAPWHRKLECLRNFSNFRKHFIFTFLHRNCEIKFVDFDVRSTQHSCHLTVVSWAWTCLLVDIWLMATILPRSALAQTFSDRY